jgi:hypothetical protein
MAKRKLSPQQRETIRKEIRLSLNQKKKQADILRAVAKKYGITTITARWYYKSIVRPVKAPTPKKAKASRAISYTPRVQATNGASLRIVQQVVSLADRSFKRVLEAKKLIPKWQSYVKKEAALKKLESKVKSDLRAISTKASALHRRIQALTSN